MLRLVNILQYLGSHFLNKGAILISLHLNFIHSCCLMLLPNQHDLDPFRLANGAR